MKKFMILALALVLALSLAACGGNETPSDSDNGSTPPAQTDNGDTDDSNGGNAEDTSGDATAFVDGEWPDNEWTQQLTAPSAGTVGNIDNLGSENQTLAIEMDWTREEAAAYCDEITATGLFDQNVIAYYKDTQMEVLLEAYNADGWEVGVSETEIRIIKPTD